jgi:hypothetical protein
LWVNDWKDMDMGLAPRESIRKAEAARYDNDRWERLCDIGDTDRTDE